MEGHDMVDRIHVTLFENEPGRFDGDSTVRATLMSDGSLELVNSARTHSGGQAFRKGTAFKAFKRTPNHPDVRGKLPIAFDPDRGPDPGTWEVVGWWRLTRAGKRHLKLSLTVMAPHNRPTQVAAAV